MSGTRRRFFARSGLLAAGGLTAPAMLVAAERPRRGRAPRHIVHLVSDGMSSGTLTCADHLSRHERKRVLTWMDLYHRPGAVPAYMGTRSLNSLVTDSAAASTAWGSGSRVKNGALNMLPDGRALKPLCSLFGEAGWARGLVTTAEITHATPAGFAANAEERGAAPLIAAQYLERRIDVLLGGGRQYFDAATRSDHRDLYADYAQAGYAVMRRREDLMNAPERARWLGVFHTGHLPFTLDQKHDPTLQAEVPTLAEMTQLALRRLAREGRFLLQVEGGRVDHGAHACDAAAALYDQLAFDEAIDVCLQFQREEPDTLLVITTDHGTGNPGLSGMGTAYGSTPKLFANLTRVRKSFETLLKEVAGPAGTGSGSVADRIRRAATDEARVVRIIGEGTGYEVPPAKTALLARYLSGQAKPLYQVFEDPEAQLGQLMANHLGIGWSSGEHTSDHAPLLALGPGAERFRGFIENTDVFDAYVGLAGIKFQNPKLPLMAECTPTARMAEFGLA